MMLSLRLRNLLVYVLLSIVACSSPSNVASSGSNQAPSYQDGSPRVGYDVVAGESLATMMHFTLCQLSRHPMFGSSGLYRVDSLVGATEEDLWNPGTSTGFTYVELSLVRGWYQAEKRVVARILGGPRTNGRSGGWRVRLQVGETIGVLLMKPAPNNRNLPGIHELGLFQRNANGRFTNGQLFSLSGADEAELGDLIAQFSGRPFESVCPSWDVAPDVSAGDQGAIEQPSSESTHRIVAGIPQADAGAR